MKSQVEMIRDQLSNQPFEDVYSNNFAGKEISRELINVFLMYLIQVILNFRILKEANTYCYVAGLLQRIKKDFWLVIFRLL